MSAFLAHPPPGPCGSDRLSTAARRGTAARGRCAADAESRPARLDAGRRRRSGIPAAAGFPTTFAGCEGDMTAREDSRLRRAHEGGLGCTVVGKTNMPEFGSACTPTTRCSAPPSTAWDRTRSAGGSSGGAGGGDVAPVVAGFARLHGLAAQPRGMEPTTVRPGPARAAVPGWLRPDLFVAQLATDG